jgi:hypothetical protein
MLAAQSTKLKRTAVAGHDAPLTGQETAATSASGGVSWPVGRVGRLFRVLLVPLIDECDTMIH